MGERVAAQLGSLTPAERKVAEIVVTHQQLVAFCTVAEVARASGAGAATVVRLAGKLGFDGFADLQRAIRNELLATLGPAPERLRQQPGQHSLETHASIELDNVRLTLDSARPGALERALVALTDLERPVALLGGEASAGVVRQFAHDLGLLRSGVQVLDGNDVARQQQIALFEGPVTAVMIDLRRYDRWVLDMARRLDEIEGRILVAITDSPVAPLAASADATFIVSAGAAGPFDSHVGTLALLNYLVLEAAARLRDTATPRLDAVERAWSGAGSLSER